MPDKKTQLENDGADSSLEPFIVLLAAHIDLISETSEDTALQMSEGLAHLRKILLRLAENGADEALIRDATDRASDMQSLLQAQDISRQQTVAVRQGLAGLAKIQSNDVMDYIETLKNGYVMPEQWDVHARVTGEEDIGDSPPNAGPMFF